jgi:hypothetical protein
MALAGCGRRTAASADAGRQSTGAGGQAAQAGQVSQGAVAPSDPTNLLIGSWRLTSYTANANLPGVTCPMTNLTFTASQVTQVGAAGSSTIPVSYIAEPTKVFVVTDTGITNAADYLILANGDVQLDAVLACTYRRVG